MPSPSPSWRLWLGFLAALRAMAVFVVFSGFALVALPAPAASAITGATDVEQQFLTLLNQTRQFHGRQPLPSNGLLALTSLEWSQHMADSGALVHEPNLGAVLGFVDPSSTYGSENIGRGTDVDGLWQAFMNSPPHRDAILDRADVVGIGAVWSGGWIWVTFRFLDGTPVPPPSDPPPPPVVAGAGYHPLDPARIFDSRDGTGMPGGWSTPLWGGGVAEVPVLGRNGVPQWGVSAVVLNVTAAAGIAPSHLTVYPRGAARPLASSLNFGTNQTVANLVWARVGSDGYVDVFNNTGAVHVVVDIMGWFDGGATPGAGELHTAPPVRLLDTRLTAPLVQGATRALQVRGVSPVPQSGVSAVVVNVTGLASSTPTHLTVWPGDTPRPVVSNLNLVPGATVPNMAVVKLGNDGSIDIFTNAGTGHVLIDVLGWFDGGGADGDGYSALTPSRLLDTRDGTGRPSPGPVPGGTDIQLGVAGRGGVPVGARVVALNVTATGGTADTHVTVFGSGASLPGTSNLNVSAGATSANLVVVPLGVNGSIRLRNNSGSLHLVADVVGWF